MLEALRLLLTRQGFEVVGEAEDGVLAVSMCQSLSPDVAVIDRSVPFPNGGNAASEIRKRAPATRIVMLTADNDRAYAQRAMCGGIEGCVTRSRSALELAEAIRELHAGHMYLTPGLEAAGRDASEHLYHTHLKAS